MREPKVLVVTATALVRDNALWIECARRFENMRIAVPDDATIGDWPTGVAVKQLPTALGKGTSRFWMRGLNSTVRDWHPDLVHVCSEPWSPTSQMIAGSGTPFVLHSAESVIASAPRLSRIRRIGMRRVLNLADGYVSWGRTGMAAMRDAGLPDSTKSLVMSAAPPDPRLFPRQLAREGEPPLRIAFVGRLVEQKGLEDLLLAVAMPQLTERSEVRVLGAGPERPRFEKLAEKYGIPVTFLGPGDERSVLDLLAWSDVLVVPSRSTVRIQEQWGRVIVEGMLVGRAVISSDSGECPHLTGDPEMIFEEGDSVGLAAILNALSTDTELLARKQHEAWLRAEQFSPSAMAQDIHHFWCEVLGSKDSAAVE